MDRIRTILARLRGSVRQDATGDELSEELSAHLEMLVDEKTSQGVPPEEARRQATLTLGNQAQIHEAYRRQEGLPFLEVLRQDLIYAVRMLLRYPGFTAVAVVTLALGIGANSAIFSIVNGVLLRPLPFANPHALVAVFNSSEQAQAFGASPPDFRTLRERNRTLAGFSAYYNVAPNLSGAQRPERLVGQVVSADYFTTLGVGPALGRNFVKGEEQWGFHHVAIVSDAFWRSRLNAERDLSGLSLILDGEKYNIIGVMPADFYLPQPTQVWAPMAWKPNDNYNSHNNYFLNMIGRLGPGISEEKALADLNSIMLSIAQQFPENKGIGVTMKPLRENWLGGVQPALAILLGAVGFVLLIACVNLANLLLARFAGRQKETAIRFALGAGRLRLLRQFLTESITLSCIGGAMGLALAYFSLRLLPLAGGFLPRMQQVSLDAQVLLFTLCLSLLTGILFGILPAFQSSQGKGINNTLKEGGRTSSLHHAGRFRTMLVISEVALAMVLLIGAGLAIRSFAQLIQVDSGFSPDRVLTFSLALPDAYDPQPDSLRIGAPPQVATFFQDLMRKIERLPGVVAAGSISGLPLQGENWGKMFFPLDRPLAPSLDQAEKIQYRAVLGHYFQSMQIRLLKGRLLDEHDQASAPFVVVVNETLARRYWPGQDPIGKEILLSPPVSLLSPGLAPAGYQPQKFSVVGVVGDVRYGGMDKTVAPVVYASILQHDFMMSSFITIRSAGDPKLLVASIRDVLQQIDKNIPMAEVTTMDEIMSTSVAQPRLEAVLLGMFGGLALILAAVGIYGVMAYFVSQRTREIGLRMALGASRFAVLHMVLGQVLRLAGAGLGIGLLLALGLTRLMAGILFGVSPSDPLTFIAIILLLAVIAGLAGYLPARRATRVDPMVALRYE